MPETPSYRGNKNRRHPFPIRCFSVSLASSLSQSNMERSERKLDDCIDRDKVPEYCTVICKHYGSSQTCMEHLQHLTYGSSCFHHQTVENRNIFWVPIATRLISPDWNTVVKCDCLYVSTSFSLMPVLIAPRNSALVQS
jgi:hypothetical protein